jgi:5'-nucleotidase
VTTLSSTPPASLASAASRPLVLISNDDGYRSPGLAALRLALQREFEVVVLAPETEQSASSHSLSLHRPLRLRSVEEGVFALDGTPADCVYVALFTGTRVLPRKPDLVLSGINLGLNLGQDVFYSGTVAAAREGALRGIPALAVSAESGADFDKVADTAARLAARLLELRRGQATLLSLNAPKAWNGHVQSARVGRRLYEERVFIQQDPRGRDYLWLGGPGVSHSDDPGADTDLFDRGIAPLVSLSLDLTCDPSIADAVILPRPER